MQLDSHILDLLSLISPSSLCYSLLSEEAQAKEVPVTTQTQQSSLGCVGWILDDFSNDTLYIQCLSSIEHEIENSATVNNLAHSKYAT